MTFTVRFRDFRKGESPRLHFIIKEAVRHSCARAYTSEQMEIWVNHHLGPNRFENYARAGKKFLLAVDADGTVIGFAGWYNNELRQLYVLPEFQKSGLGSCLLKEALARAKAADTPLLEVNASLNAETFYRRHGFRREVENRPPPHNIPYVYMVRDDD